jgi:hypothetical protein
MLPVSQRFMLAFLFCSDDRGIMLLRNVGSLRITSHHIRKYRNRPSRRPETLKRNRGRLLL